MKKVNSQSGFGAIESLLIIVIVGLIGFTGWYVYHAQQNANKNLTSSTSASPTFKDNAKKSVTTAVPAASSSSQYLTVKEFGIKIPTTSSTSDLGYIYQPTGGYESLPVAILGSKTLAQEAAKDDPTDCTPARLAQTDGLYPISYVYSTKWEVDGGGGQGIAKASVSVSGKGYFWYELHAGAGCDTGGSTADSSDFTNYYNTVLNSFSSTVAE